MRFLMSAVILLVLMNISDGIGQETSEKGDLIVMINGFDNNEGVAKIALSNTQEDYEAHDQAFRGEETIINEKSAVLTFEKIPFGEYAIKIYHDEDNDNELNSNFLGMPTEEYGFSNNARGSFGPASWDDAKFLFNTPKDTVKIKVE
jgi:uncharacterized protein (DUF2141 family)